MTPSFQQTYGPWAVVAGASQGIGAAFSQEIARQGVNVIMIARTLAPLEATAQSIRQQYRVQVRTHSLDLATPDLAEQFQAIIQDVEVGLLIYNAAASEIKPYVRSSLDSKFRQLDLNCRGPLTLTSLCGEKMATRGRGGLLLMSSATSLRGTELLVTYAATKAFNTTLAEGLWQELGPKGVHVLGVVAGAIRTPNYENSNPQQNRIHATAQAPESLAQNALARLGRGYPIWFSSWQVRLSELLFSRLLPRSTGIRMLGRITRQLYPHVGEGE
ncbi:MAG TPA: SDR family NAD(P)-dependent oxidoreductase [Anaerolineales bacterium]|nr:SDR family NAD(P)-dependent oxidoreductase [Anaerolineales bacterium]